MFLKSCEMLGVMAELRREKMDLEVRLLNRLEELQKTWDEMSELQEVAASTQSKISSLREEIDKERAKKLELKHKVRLLENLEHCKNDVKELRVDASR